jgi:hypothetical protein
MWGSTKLTSSNKNSQITKGTKEQPKKNQATHMGARSKRYLNLEAQNNNKRIANHHNKRIEQQQEE